MTPIPPKPGTQKHKLLEWAKHRGWFSNLEATRELWIECSWKRRDDLEKDGWVFEARDAETTTGTKIKQFRLVLPAQVTLDEIMGRG